MVFRRMGAYLFCYVEGIWDPLLDPVRKIFHTWGPDMGSKWLKRERNVESTPKHERGTILRRRSSEVVCTTPIPRRSTSKVV